jgi:tagatose-1,6-bisphosphate aldolase non-catalytic subunit AgaZ/GatZ
VTKDSARWKRYVLGLSNEQYTALCAKRAEYMREYWQRPEVKARRNELARAARKTKMCSDIVRRDHG